MVSLIAETLLTHKDLAAGLAQIELSSAWQARIATCGGSEASVKVDARQSDLQAKRGASGPHGE